MGSGVIFGEELVFDDKMAEYPELGISENELSEEIKENLRELDVCISKVKLYASLDSSPDVVSSIRTYSDYIARLKQVQMLHEFGVKYFDTIDGDGFKKVIENAEVNLEGNLEIILSRTCEYLCFNILNQERLLKIISSWDADTL